MERICSCGSKFFSVIVTPCFLMRSFGCLKVRGIIYLWICKKGTENLKSQEKIREKSGKFKWHVGCHPIMRYVHCI